MSSSSESKSNVIDIYLSPTTEEVITDGEIIINAFTIKRLEYIFDLLPNIAHISNKSKRVISKSSTSYCSLFRQLYEHVDGNQWRLIKDRMKEEELDKVLINLEEASKNFHTRNCMCLPSVMNDKLYHDEHYNYSTLIDTNNCNDRLVINMRPDINIMNDGSSNYNLLTVKGGIRDMFGLNQSQWFLDRIDYKIDGIEVKSSDSSIKEDILDRVSIDNVDIYSGRYYSKNQKRFSIQDEYYSVQSNDSNKTVQIKLNYFNDGTKYDGLKSIIARYISCLDIYRLNKTPTNAHIPLIIPFDWQVPLNKNERLSEVRITIEMTAYRLITEPLRSLNSIQRSSLNVKRQISQFHFKIGEDQLLSNNDDKNLYFSLENIERINDDIVLNITS